MHTQNILRINNVKMACKITEYLSHWALTGPLRVVRWERHDVNNIRDLERALQAEWVRINCRSLENWFAVWDVIVWQSWLRMVGTLGIEPCPNFYAWPP